MLRVLLKSVARWLVGVGKGWEGPGARAGGPYPCPSRARRRTPPPRPRLPSRPKSRRAPAQGPRDSVWAARRGAGEPHVSTGRRTRTALTAKGSRAELESARRRAGAPGLSQHAVQLKLCLTPYDEFSVLEPMPNSSMLVFPSTTAPAPRSLATAVASKVGTYPRRICDPAVVRRPAVQMLSWGAGEPWPEALGGPLGHTWRRGGEAPCSTACAQQHVARTDLHSQRHSCKHVQAICPLGRDACVEGASLVGERARKAILVEPLPKGPKRQQVPCLMHDRLCYVLPLYMLVGGPTCASAFSESTVT